MSHEIVLRPAEKADCKSLWEWRNDSTTREASFVTGIIPYIEHKQWFSRKLQDRTCKIFIVTSNGHKIGYVRFETVKQVARISVSIDRKERGKGYGPSAIKMASDRLLESGQVKRIVAYVKKDNPFALAAFQRAGFSITGTPRIMGIEAVEMTYTRGKAKTEATRKADDDGK